MRKALAVLGCLLINTASYSQLSQLHINNGVLKDSDNRTIILNGCVTITHHGSGFQPYSLNNYKRLKSWGANYQSIRLFASGIVDYYGYPCSADRDKVLYPPHFYVKISYPYDLSGYLTRMNRFINEAIIHNAPIIIGEYGRPWFADDNAEVNGIPQLNWALIKGTSGLDGAEREFITNGFSRPYPKATAGNLLDYQFFSMKTGLL
jgi:hypothetical protein